MNAKSWHLASAAQNLSSSKSFSSLGTRLARDVVTGVTSWILIMLVGMAVEPAPVSWTPSEDVILVIDEATCIWAGALEPWIIL